MAARKSARTATPPLWQADYEVNMSPWHARLAWVETPRGEARVVKAQLAWVDTPGVQTPVAQHAAARATTPQRALQNREASARWRAKNKDGLEALKVLMAFKASAASQVRANPTT
jgi:hypothetical protein